MTIKKEELGLSKKQFIKNRKIVREKANEKKWEDMKATMDRVREHVLCRDTSLQGSAKNITTLYGH